MTRIARAPAVCRSRQGGGIILKLLALLMCLFVLGAIYLLRRPLLREAAGLLIINEALQPSDAIVVLGDDNYPADRAARAAELYRDRWAPRVVASGRYLRPYASIADLERRDLVERGVDAAHVVHFPHNAANTREEAFALRELIEKQRWRRVMVVTSTYHTRRARYVFRRALDPATELRVVAARDAGFNPDAWWESRSGVKIFFRELLAWPVAWWEMRNSDKPPPKND